MRSLTQAVLLSSSLVSFFFSSFASAETAMRDDGRKVRLNEDGSWEFVSDDVYATSESGLRVVLSADGSWQPVEKKAVVESRLATAPQATTNSVFAVTKFEVEKVAIERGGNSKFEAFEFQMLIYLSASRDFEQSQVLANNFSLTDNKAKSYDIVSAKVMDNGEIRVIAKGAPKRFSRVKSMTLGIDKSVANTLADIAIQYDYRDVDNRRRRELTE